jgi:hypothetical protein
LSWRQLRALLILDLQRTRVNRWAPRYKSSHCVSRTRTYSNLKVDRFLRKCWHLIVEAESVLSNALSRKYKVALPFLGSI